MEKAAEAVEVRVMEAAAAAELEVRGKAASVMGGRATEAAAMATAGSARAGTAREGSAMGAAAMAMAGSARVETAREGLAMAGQAARVGAQVELRTGRGQHHELGSCENTESDTITVIVTHIPDMGEQPRHHLPNPS